MHDVVFELGETNTKNDRETNVWDCDARHLAIGRRAKVRRRGMLSAASHNSVDMQSGRQQPQQQHMYLHQRDGKKDDELFCQWITFILTVTFCLFIYTVYLFLT